MKKKIAIIIMLVLLIATPAHAGKWFIWDEKNTELHVPLTVLFVADLGQTLYIADHCTPDPVTGVYEESESNIFLGNCPSREEVREYFGWAYLITTGLTYALPEKWSHWFQKGTITVEVMAVGDNFSVNVGWGF